MENRSPGKDLETIRASERGCFVIEKNTPRKIQFFSEQTNQLYSLMPTERAPTMLISGIPMHRVKNTDPHADTLEKIKTIAPITGTCSRHRYRLGVHRHPGGANRRARHDD